MTSSIKNQGNCSNKGNQEKTSETIKYLAEHLLQDVYSTPRTTLCRRTAGIFLDKLIEVIFPERGVMRFTEVSALEATLNDLYKNFCELLACVGPNHEYTCNHFFAALPEIEKTLQQDAAFITSEDPAARSVEEVILCYPGFYAIAVYRLAHKLDELKVRFLPRLFAELAHSSTGIDIHPAAKIGVPFLIDHGTGIVIGETSILGNRVKLYQGVTLGALSVSKAKANEKRHPTLEDDCIIYANATILGGTTTIGKGATIGGSVWITESVPPASRVFHQSSTKVSNGSK